MDDDDRELEPEPPPRPVLIAGIGRESRRDAGLGLIAARVLQSESLGDQVEVLEAAGWLSLILELADRDRVLAIVAAHMGLEPGAMRLLAPEELETELCEPVVAPRGLSLTDLLDVGGMFEDVPPVSVLAVQPAEVAPGTGLSVVVGQALPRVVEQVRVWLDTP